MNEIDAAPARRGNTIKSLLALFVLVACSVGYLFYHRFAIAHPATEDAYVHANVVRIAPLVGGAVTAVHVDNHQFVRAGMLLFELDAALPSLAVRVARAQFNVAAQALEGDRTALQEAANTIKTSRVELMAAQDSLVAVRAAFTNGTNTEAQLVTALAAADAARTNFEQAGAALDTVSAALPPGSASVASARLQETVAQLQRSELQLALTQVVAPVTGWVGNLSVRPGATVGVGMPTLSLVADERWWVDANYKESDLARIRQGQRATIKLDMYPGTTWTGVVEAVSIGSGAAFALLPPENASGNWVKVTQRFPVRVSLEPTADVAQRPLRLGASAHVRIDTTDSASTPPSR